MKNNEGLCVFHNGRKCNIYGNRKDAGAILFYMMTTQVAFGWTTCPPRNQFKLSKSNRETIVRRIFKSSSRAIRTGS